MIFRPIFQLSAEILAKTDFSKKNYFNVNFVSVFLFSGITPTPFIPFSVQVGQCYKTSTLIFHEASHVVDSKFSDVTVIALLFTSPKVL